MLYNIRISDGDFNIRVWGLPWMTLDLLTEP